MGSLRRSQYYYDKKNGDFTVKPIPVSDAFKRKLEDSIVLIYTNGQRDQDAIAQSHENKDKKKYWNYRRKLTNISLMRT